MQPINSTSFCGHIVRERQFVRDPKTNELYHKETTPEEFVKTYDRQKDKIESYKQFAIKLDDMMHKDPDIQKALKELPNNLDIELYGNCAFNADGDEKEAELVSPGLYANEEIIDKTPKAQKMDRQEKGDAVYLDCDFDKNGPDKKEILDWLNKLGTFFK